MNNSMMDKTLTEADDNKIMVTTVPDMDERNENNVKFEVGKE
jgi:hypothetical protein